MYDIFTYYFVYFVGNLKLFLDTFRLIMEIHDAQLYKAMTSCNKTSLICTKCHWYAQNVQDMHKMSLICTRRHWYARPVTVMHKTSLICTRRHWYARDVTLIYTRHHTWNNIKIRTCDTIVNDPTIHQRSNKVNVNNYRQPNVLQFTFLNCKDSNFFY